jgi:prefoldin subunit 5
MSTTLRATQKGYAEKIAGFDRQIAQHEKAISDIKKQKADVESAKEGVDKLVAALPPEPKAKPAKTAGK